MTQVKKTYGGENAVDINLGRRHSTNGERHFRFPVVVTGVTTLSVEQCPAAPENDGPEKGRLSRPSGLRVMSMYHNYEIHSEADLPR